MRCPMLIRHRRRPQLGAGRAALAEPESTFAHYPGLTVVMPSSRPAILDMYPHHQPAPGPVISIGASALYNLDFTVSPSDIACRSPATSRAGAAT